MRLLRPLLVLFFSFLFSSVYAQVTPADAPREKHNYEVGLESRLV